MRTSDYLVDMAVLLTLTVILAGCIQPNPFPALTPTPTEEPERVLDIYNWETYINPHILNAFEQQYDVSINYRTYTDDTDMLDDVRAGRENYDLVVPSDYLVAIMRREGLLYPLDKRNIPNFVNVDSEFTSPTYDPGNRYCAPYQWGTAGIGYDSTATEGEITGWEDFFDQRYAGRIALMDDARSTLGVILLYLGYSPNTTDGEEVAAARNFLLDHADAIAAYAPDTGQDLLVADEVDLVFEWSGDILQVMGTHPEIRYVIPKEGSLIWTDNICIPATARHKELAEEFINYLLDPEVGASLSNYTHYSTPNRAALPLINAADRNNPALYPPAEIRSRLFFLVDVGETANKLYEEAWQLVLERHGR